MVRNLDCKFLLNLQNLTSINLGSCEGSKLSNSKYELLSTSFVLGKDSAIYVSYIEERVRAMSKKINVLYFDM